MIRATFRQRAGHLTGFTVQGHAGFAGQGEDIVCAAVSSAAYLTVNTLTDVLHIRADCTVQDGFLSVAVPDGEGGAWMLEGFRLHMEQLREQYPRRIKITTEVEQNA